MPYKIFADLIVVMLAGFVLTLMAFRRKQYFDKWLFRTLHLCGIAYVTLLELLGKYCPLTILENSLRAKYSLELRYPGSFIAYYIKKLVYPDVNPLILIIPTAIIAIFTIVVFIIRPPAMIRKILIHK